jgi:hypothetical protein
MGILHQHTRHRSRLEGGDPMKRGMLLAACGWGFPDTDAVTPLAFPTQLFTNGD